MAAGKLIEKITFEDSIIEEDQPVIFAHKNNKYEFISNTSCSIKEDKALIRLSRGMKIEGDAVTRVGIGPKITIWYGLKDSAKITANDEKYSIKLKTINNSKQLQLQGNEFLLDTHPSVTYLGIPGIHNPDKAEITGCKTILINKKRINTIIETNPAGRISFDVIDKDDNIVLRRRIGILPKNFDFKLKSEQNEEPPQISFSGAEHCTILFDTKKIKAEPKYSHDNNTFYLHPLGEAPHFFKVAVLSPTCPKPVIINFPYPQVGVRLIDANENEFISPSLNINKLLGMRLILSSALMEKQNFHVNMRLISRDKRFNPEINYCYTADQTPVIVNLFSLRNDLIQLLSTVNDQDASIRVTINLDANRTLLDFSIKRYEGDVYWNSLELSIMDTVADVPINGAIPIAMDLSDPGKEEVVLEERETEGVGTGSFSIHKDMMKDGPWLVLPQKDSPVNFRPRLYKEMDNLTVPNEVNSLHSASRHFAHFHDQTIMDEVIDNMSYNFNSSSWLYMRDLFKNYSHLPLSSFEPWIALAKNPRAMTAATFKLDLNEAILNRIRDELAFLWENIPVPIWKLVYNDYKEFLASQGFDETVQKMLLNKKMTIIRKSVSIMEHLTEYIVEEKIPPVSKMMVEQALKIWNQENMCKHKDRFWLTNLGKELDYWIQTSFENKKVFSIQKNLPLNHYSKSVVYLPFFMARVTLGLATLEDLGIFLNHVKLDIKRLIDFDQEWFFPAHSLMTTYLLQKQIKE
ncbi:MAG: hypothetical protein GY816_22700 [Cytophagales bacterium]|nr:hypothetical protein [Cytophagales bacterium]